MLEKITLQSENDWDRTVRGRVLAHDVTRPGCKDIILAAGTRLTNRDMWTLYTAGVDELILMNSPAETATARREF